MSHQSNSSEKYMNSDSSHLAAPGTSDVQAQRLMIDDGRSRAALLVAAIASAFGGTSASRTPRKERRPVPRMVCSPAHEIAAWNAAIDARKPRVPSKLHRKTRGDTGQHPKFAKGRVHKQHKHPLRDEHGAYTQVGKAHTWPAADFPDEFDLVPRRKWLAGISAQRGY